jgi:hypothetical protein
MSLLTKFDQGAVRIGFILDKVCIKFIYCKTETVNFLLSCAHPDERIIHFIFHISLSKIKMVMLSFSESSISFMFLVVAWLSFRVKNNARRRWTTLVLLAGW